MYLLASDVIISAVLLKEEEKKQIHAYLVSHCWVIFREYGGKFVILSNNVEIKSHVTLAPKGNKCDYMW